MPLQNRVDPLGGIHAVSERGLFTGNRRVNPQTPQLKQLLKRRWTTKAWIICNCGFRSASARCSDTTRPAAPPAGQICSFWTRSPLLPPDIGPVSSAGAKRPGNMPTVSARRSALQSRRSDRLTSACMPSGWRQEAGGQARARPRSPSQICPGRNGLHRRSVFRQARRHDARLDIRGVWRGMVD